MKSTTNVVFISYISVVLSSDDEESSPSPESVSTLARPLVAGEDELLQGQMSHEAVTEPSDSALQDVEVSALCVCVLAHICFPGQTIYISGPWLNITQGNSAYPSLTQ